VLKMCFSLIFVSKFFFGEAIWSQGLILARQVLYHLSHVSSLVNSLFFSLCILFL
jgi:hypothetical protein